MGVNEQRLCGFLFMGKPRGWLFNHPLLLRAHVSHVARLMRVVAGRGKEIMITDSYSLPRAPVHCFGPSPTGPVAVYGPGPGAPIGVLKYGSF